MVSSLCFSQGRSFAALRMTYRTSSGTTQILRCAQDDISHLAGSFPKKPPRVSGSEGGVLLDCAVEGLPYLEGAVDAAGGEAGAGGGPGEGGDATGGGRGGGDGVAGGDVPG